MKRCINIDWLECYCLEDSIGYPHNAQYFRNCGFMVREREYGTPVYEEMFILLGTDDQPLLEIRRSPKSAKGKQLHGVLEFNACHIRLTNRTCYFNNPVQILQQFLEQYGFHYQRISRIDICLDFEKFDYGDLPSDFVDRYMKHKYSKINQAELSAHGRDMWDGRRWNSLKWGEPKSMVSTKLYNKSMELEQVHDKPYIRQAWRACGLVDDEYYLTKLNETGETYKPQIWRVEFSVKSSTRNWYVVEDCNGSKPRILSKRNTLDTYQTKDDLMNVFFSLCEHYFHFKKFKPSVRKDRCEDKLLFRTSEKNTFYKIENVATAVAPEKQIQKLAALIRQYRDTHSMPDIYKACNILLYELEKEARTASLTTPWPASELTAIRLLIAKHINNPAAPQSSLSEIRELLNIEKNIFGEK